MPLSERLLRIAQRMDDSGSAEASTVATYIRDELVPLAEEEVAELDECGVLESLREISDAVEWACEQLSYKEAKGA